MTTTHKTRFTANCVAPVAHNAADDVLAEALSVINEHHPIVSQSATRSGDIVTVAVTFWAANTNEAVRTAGLTAEALAHRWPTDAARLDGKPFKYHREPRAEAVTVDADTVPGYRVIKARDLTDTHVLSDVFGRPKPLRSVKTVQRKGNLQPVVQVTFADGESEPFLADSDVTIITQEA